ncbi:MAG: cbb3-type cytochrome c oxidase subunit I [Candidatus Thiodiazotropha sp.]
MSQRQLSRRWLQLGVLSLGIAGIFAVLLVVSRTPGSETFFPWIDFFHTALVVHVDQSVLIWFLSMTGLVWSLLLPPSPTLQLWQRVALMLALLGTLGVALSAFVGQGAPLMNNYVPVLTRPFFFAMLALFGLGMLLQSLLALNATRRSLVTQGWEHLPTLAGLTLSVALIVSCVCLGFAWLQMPADVQGQAYYEYLFWGGGHTLQFAYTQLIVLAWLLLAHASGVRVPGDVRWFVALLLLGVAPVLLSPLIYLLHGTLNLESRTAFTRLMQFGGGLAVVPVGILVLLGLLRSGAAAVADRPVRRALWMSLLLFFAGGVIAMFISGVNTIIPAHYHGSIVGVTLALMGLAYLLLPQLGYAPVRGRLAGFQPWVYGFGQLIHIAGLAASGAMGIQRKTAGAAQGLDSLSAKLAMGVMGIGGLLAVIGGILFVWVMLQAFVAGRGSGIGSD